MYIGYHIHITFEINGTKRNNDKMAYGPMFVYAHHSQRNSKKYNLDEPSHVIVKEKEEGILIRRLVI
jgi:hypothetical protein